MKRWTAVIAFFMCCFAFASEVPKGQTPTVTQKEAPLLIVDKKPVTCPFCSEKKVAKILWGKPRMTPELDQKIKSGEVSLGGCVVPENAPTWKCIHCGATFIEAKKTTMPPKQKGEVLNEIQKNIQNYQKSPKSLAN